MLNKKTKQIALETGVIALTALAFLEVALRVVHPIAKHANSGKVTQNLPGIKPLIVYTEIAPSIRSRSITMENLKKGKRTIRVLFVGASTTQEGAQETEDTWYSLVEKKLQSKLNSLDVRLETVAYGSSGKRASDRAAWLSENMEIFDPDILVTLEGINDVSWNGGPDYTYDGDIEKKINVSSKAIKERNQKIKILLNNYSELYRNLRKAYSIIVSKISVLQSRNLDFHSSNLPRLRREMASLPQPESIERGTDPLMEFTDSMKYILSMAQKRNVSVIVMGQPVLWKSKMTAQEIQALWFPIATASGNVNPSGILREKEMERFNAAQRELARQANATYLPLEKFVPRDLDNLFDDCHFTDKGNESVAEALEAPLWSEVNKIMKQRGLATVPQ